MTGRRVRGRHERPRDDRRRSLQPSLLAAGVVAALATTGGVATVVGWSSESTSETFTVHAAAIPRVAPPSAHASTRPRIWWQAVRLADDVPVQRYVVTRHLGGVAQVACDIPATARPRCTDRYAPAGYRATYTVAARHGAHWTGADSAPSPAVTTPGVAVPISVNGMLIVPGADGAPVVVGAAPASAAPSAGPSGTAAPPPSAAPSEPADVVTEPPVVHVPPAPPVHGNEPEPGTEVPDRTGPGKPEKTPGDKTPGEPGAGPVADPVTESGGTPKGPGPAATEATPATGD